MQSALEGKIHNRHLSASLPFIVFILFSTVTRAFGQTDSETHFYNRLRSEDFTKMMIPKEKYLLGIIKNVTEELANRRSEGQTSADLGIDEIRSPKDVLIKDYDSEVRAMERLISQIEGLEQQAKRRVDMEVLHSLEQLKERLKSFLAREIQSLDAQHELQAQRMQSEPRPGTGSREAFSLNQIQDPYPEETLASGDLFEQWKYNRVLDYKLRLAKYQFYREKLKNNSNSIQSKRMFQRDLQQALLTYNSGDFECARLQLQDVLDQYANSHILDDVMYFRNESSYALNYLDEALEGFQRLAATYPNSEFAPKAMVRQIYIHYIYGNVNKQVEVFQRLLIRRTQISPGNWGTLTYLVGYSQFQSGQFRNALETLGYVGTGTSYYYPSQYLSAACYSNLGENDSAIRIYQQLIDNPGYRDNPMLSQLRNNALLKLGLISYENGQTQQARDYFGRVSSGSEGYDLSRLGDAWAAYQEGRPAEALESVESILNDNMLSNYMYEARVLAASSKELLGQNEAALRDLKQVAGMRERTAEVSTDSRRQEKEQALYREAKRIQRFLRGEESESIRLDRSDQTEFAGTQQKLQGEIENLDDLEGMAKTSDQTSLSQIRQLRGQMIETLQDHTLDGRKTETSRNDLPLIRQMGMAEYLKYLFRSLLMNTLSEKDRSRNDIETAGQLMADAKSASRFKISLNMEIRKEELEDYYAALNQYEVWLKENLPKEFQVEVDQWTSFSSYGISNINFNRIKDIDEQTAQISRIMSSIDRVFQDKRIKLEKRIQGLLSDVSRVEAQMKVETDKRLERERESFFNTKYFNKQDREPVVN